MDKQNQGKLMVGIVVAIGVVLALVYFGYIETTEPIETPGDLSEGEAPGMTLTYTDKNGVERPFPKFFSIQKPVGFLGTIIKPASVSTVTCSDRTECTGYDTDPNIICWDSECTLSNVGSMSIGIGVENSGNVPYDDVYVSAATPAAFYIAGITGTGNFATTKTVLDSGGSASWISGNFDVTAYEGTSRTFTVDVTGTNRFTGDASILGSGSIELRFEEDPTGSGLSVALVTGVPTA